MVGRWLGGINSLRSGGENDGSANSPPAFSHINSSRKVSPTTTNSPFERTSPLLWPKQCNYSTLPNALNMSHIMTLSQVEYISSYYKQKAVTIAYQAMPITGAILPVFVRWSICRRVLVSAVTVNNPCIDKPKHSRAGKVPKLLSVTILMFGLEHILAEF